MKFPSSRRVRALLAIGPLVGLSWLGAYAAFTDSVDVTTSFSTGTVQIRANDQTGTVAFTSLTTTGMIPGTVRFAPLRITNSGTSDFNYSMRTAVTGSAPLASALVVGIKVVPSGTCTSTEYNASRTVVHGEAAGLGSAAIAARPLAAAASEFLCYRVELPSAADNSLQGLTSNATFTFTATT
ncbi:MAG TPA: SipW-dependent-type signal peptide-containing protein [Conexibacter sp.]|nr:SipW-dependent-type signal peptide-containing protein [Conexibacter sp.]